MALGRHLNILTLLSYVLIKYQLRKIHSTYLEVFCISSGELQNDSEGLGIR
jgi:hypothetical protein